MSNEPEENKKVAGSRHSFRKGAMMFGSDLPKNTFGHTVLNASNENIATDAEIEFSVNDLTGDPSVNVHMDLTEKVLQNMMASMGAEAVKKQLSDRNIDIPIGEKKKPIFNPPPAFPEVEKKKSNRANVDWLDLKSLDDIEEELDAEEIDLAYDEDEDTIESFTKYADDVIKRNGETLTPKTTGVEKSKHRFTKVIEHRCVDSSCNALLKEGAKFCSTCGKPQRGRYCMECGSEFKARERFCSDCGNSR